jgi:hypothetical protein
MTSACGPNALAAHPSYPPGMSLLALKAALDQAGEASCCHGTYALTERLAIALPDGDLGAADDASFVDWLRAHAEPAPFGVRKQTKVDKNVRDAQRLVARSKVKIGGFEPAKILDEVERALSPTRKLDARLTDVILYPEGGKFSRHKDTPRTSDLVGTLVVEIPHAHEGGAFVVDDNEQEVTFDWGTPHVGSIRWVALFSDVDHEVKPVTRGTRITLVYALVRTDTPRTDPDSQKRLEVIRAAAANVSNVPWPVMIACTRQVIIEENAWPDVSALKGLDRDIAEVFGEAGFDVAVRACMFASQTSAESGMPDMGDVYQMMRLKKPITKKAIARFDDILTFSETLSSDEGDFEGDEIENMSLARFIDDEIGMDHWIFRARAEATMIHEASMFSDDGYFGNEAYEAFIYTLAALEISPKTSKGPRPRPAVVDEHEDEDNEDEDDENDEE